MLVTGFSFAQTTPPATPAPPATTIVKKTTTAKKTDTKVTTTKTTATKAAVTKTTTTTKKVVTPVKTVTKSTTTVVVEKKPAAAELAEGKELLSKADCLSCHKVDTKVVGPAYIDVAKKYPASEANYELLSKKVIAGGSGNWGSLAMAPHPTIPPADVKKMVEYILSLK